MGIWVSTFCYYEYTAMSACVKVSVWTHVFISLGYTSRRTARSYNSVFCLLRTCQNCFPKHLHHFTFLPAVSEGSFQSLHVFAKSYFVFSLVVLICVPLITDDVKHLFTCWLTTYTIFAEKSIQILYPFKNYVLSLWSYSSL